MNFLVQDLLYLSDITKTSCFLCFFASSVLSCKTNIIVSHLMYDLISEKSYICRMSAIARLEFTFRSEKNSPASPSIIWYTHDDGSYYQPSCCERDLNLPTAPGYPKLLSIFKIVLWCIASERVSLGAI